MGTTLAMGATLFASIYYVAMRKYRTVHFAAMNLLQGLTGLVDVGILVVAMKIFAVPDTIDDIILMAAMGILSALANITIILALKFEKAGIVSLEVKFLIQFYF